MTEFLQQLINGLAFGSILALIALGYTMVYGILRFINFAHGDVFMLGAFAGLYLATKIAVVLPLPSIAGALVVLGISMAVCAARLEGRRTCLLGQRTNASCAPSRLHWSGPRLPAPRG